MQIEINRHEQALIVSALRELTSQIKNNLCPEYQKLFPDRYEVCKETAAKTEELIKKVASV